MNERDLKWRDSLVIYKDEMSWLSIATRVGEAWSFEKLYIGSRNIKKKCIARMVPNLGLVVNINANMVHVRELEKYFKSINKTYTYVNEPRGIPDPDKVPVDPVDSAKHILGDNFVMPGNEDEEY